MPTSIKSQTLSELRCGRFTLRLGRRTHLMGVLNRTPDSFSDGGKFMNEEVAIGHILEMARDGADIIDIGGESTRPHSDRVSLQEELRRTIPIIKKISGKLQIPISIDTSKHEVAREAIRAGASVVNDVTGLKSDPEMAAVIADSEAAICVMHMRGTPKDMQVNPTYGNLMAEIVEGLRESVEIALAHGITEDRIIVDPGIGFGKTVEHNLVILNRLKELEILEKPILVGPSRKSFIGALLGKDTAERLMGTLAASVVAVMNGANILRVHDVKEVADAAKIADSVRNEGG